MWMLLEKLLEKAKIYLSYSKRMKKINSSRVTFIAILTALDGWYFLTTSVVSRTFHANHPRRMR
jgi:hypothetical protein